MKLLLVLLFGFSFAFSLTVKVAQYNVQNLFDLQRSGREYKEYIPFTQANWNKKTYNIKLKNIARVLADIDADIVALEEIESSKGLKDLQKTLQTMGLYYKYAAIADRKKTTVHVALLSKYKPLYTKELAVGRSYKYRNILEAKFSINNQELYFFVNHWKSKSAPESSRIVSAKVVQKRLENLGYNKNIILTGDFNSDYEEYMRFKRKRKLNDTNGITGINHILKTIDNQATASQVALKPNTLYNLWYDLPREERWNYIHRKKPQTLDSIIVSKPLLRQGGITYIYGSFGHFLKNYLLYKKRINSWYIRYRKKSRRHMGKGYSDHLPIIATFKFE